ncbi:ABC transporter ATP-binding protein [Caldalkalibacillus thermarum TA2.A1]|uniref:ABC transporter ATP-binding protein n=1 Tax=Caldalkalibacillus thermarum (strain TA2.A1) TaxID=986075 RepID=A0A8X8IA32_CALTT|nr:ABC transporter ATP-binding protein [Caldalkalibacillus thermarum]QZT33590.1 ABC transporter ATP-binding protein [Caldalkalibacillus thermarum TA2.A1]
MLLEIKHLSVAYESAQIINDVSFHVEEGELVSLVGPNGAGKSTVLRAVAGLINWEKKTMKGIAQSDIKLTGDIRFDGHSVFNLMPHEIAAQGLVLCPERRRPFKEMTVLENLIAGGYLCKNQAELKRRMEQVYTWFPRLKERENQISGTLSGGEQQMLAIGRSLMMKPRLLCIDEPSVGLAKKVKEELFQRIREIRDSGITVLLVEQEISLTFQIIDRSYILSHGQLIAQGRGEELLADDTLRQSYLGM